MKGKFGISVSLSGKERGKEMGRLRDLRLHLGDLTREVIEWIVDPVNWWHLCQQSRAEAKNHRVSEYPDIGLLLLRRGSALRVMRSKLNTSLAGAEFIKKLDQKQYEQTKALALLYAEGKCKRLAKIEAAKTLTDIQQVLNELIDESKADSTNEIQCLRTPLDPESCLPGCNQLQFFDKFLLTGKLVKQNNDSS
jgi:hypothetical protein